MANCSLDDYIVQRGIRVTGTNKRLGNLNLAPSTKNLQKKPFEPKNVITLKSVNTFATHPKAVISLGSVKTSTARQYSGVVPLESVNCFDARQNNVVPLESVVTFDARQKLSKTKPTPLIQDARTKLSGKRNGEVNDARQLLLKKQQQQQPREDNRFEQINAMQQQNASLQQQQQFPQNVNNYKQLIQSVMNNGSIPQVQQLQQQFHSGSQSSDMMNFHQSQLPLNALQGGVGNIQPQPLQQGGFIQQPQQPMQGQQQRGFEINLQQPQLQHFQQRSFVNVNPQQMQQAGQQISGVNVQQGHLQQGGIINLQRAQQFQPESIVNFQQQQQVQQGGSIINLPPQIYQQNANNNIQHKQQNQQQRRANNVALQQSQQNFLQTDNSYSQQMPQQPQMSGQLQYNQQHLPQQQPQQQNDFISPQQQTKRFLNQKQQLGGRPAPAVGDMRIQLQKRVKQNMTTSVGFTDHGLDSIDYIGGFTGGGAEDDGMAKRGGPLVTFRGGSIQKMIRGDQQRQSNKSCDLIMPPSDDSTNSLPPSQPLRTMTRNIAAQTAVNSGSTRMMVTTAPRRTLKRMSYEMEPPQPIQTLVSDVPVKVARKQAVEEQLYYDEDEFEEKAEYVSPLQGVRVRISNLAPTVSQDDILELFGSVGAIKKVSGIKGGSSDIWFVDVLAAQKSIKKYHKRELDGLPMNVVLDSSVSGGPSNVLKLQQQQQRAGLKATAGIPWGDNVESDYTGPQRANVHSMKNAVELEQGILHQALFRSAPPDPVLNSRPVNFTVRL